MYELTGKSRRWNTEQKCKGQRVDCTWRNSPYQCCITSFQSSQNTSKSKRACHTWDTTKKWCEGFAQTLFSCRWIRSERSFGVWGSSKSIWEKKIRNNKKSGNRIFRFQEGPWKTYLWIQDPKKFGFQDGSWEHYLWIQCPKKWSASFNFEHGSWEYYLWIQYQKKWSAPRSLFVKSPADAARESSGCRITEATQICQSKCFSVAV